MVQNPIKVSSYFQIPPTTNTDNVVFMNVGFKLSDIKLITIPKLESKLMYVFHVHIGYSDDFKLRFEFERKIDCISAQRELTRAWTETGEYSRSDNAKQLEETNNV